MSRGKAKSLLLSLGKSKLHSIRPSRCHYYLPTRLIDIIAIAGLWYLAQLSTIVQLYRGENHRPAQVIDNLYRIMFYRVHITRVTTLMVINIDR